MVSLKASLLYRTSTPVSAVSETMHNAKRRLRKACLGKMRLLLCCVMGICANATNSQCDPIPTDISNDPYVGAIVTDAESGQILFQNEADNLVYPAGIVKLMGILIAVEKLEKGEMALSDKVRMTGEAAQVGGVQVWLSEGEEHSVDDLLFAMAVRSANDAAVALAIHMAGSADGFVKIMNERAGELGMKSTVYRSVHGLPPREPQDMDVTTVRDQAVLAGEAVKHAAILRYTSTQSRVFRPDAPDGKGRVDMRNVNNALSAMEGCDGLKTGYFRAAGYSTVVTAKQNDRRVITVVMGSKTRATRDAEVQRLMSDGFAKLVVPPPPKMVQPVPGGQEDQDSDRGQEAPVTGTANLPPAINLDVKRMSTVRDSARKWETDYGSYEEDISRSISIQITVSSMRSEPAAVTLEWYFVAKSVSGSARWVYDMGEEKLTVARGKPVELKKKSQKLEVSVRNYAAIDVKYESGGKVDGYIVRVMAGDRILAVSAASNPLEQLARDPAKLAAIVKAGKAARH